MAGDATKAGAGRAVPGAMRVEKRGSTHYLAVRTADGEKYLPLPTAQPD